LSLSLQTLLNKLDIASLKTGRMKLIALLAALILVSVAVVESDPPADCSEILLANRETPSGVYEITVPGVGVTKAYCDMDTACGGWTVIQRRQDGSVNFQRNWADYKNGFGNVNGEYWLGNKYLTALTNARPYRLRFEIIEQSGQLTHAEYNNFKVAGEDQKYKMTYDLGSWFGTLADNLGGAPGPNKHMYIHHNMKFSTIDQDNDNHPTDSCAKRCHGGWWYNACELVNPNGQYGNQNREQGINWGSWSYSHKYIDMKIRSNIM